MSRFSSKCEKGQILTPFPKFRENRIFFPKSEKNVFLYHRADTPCKKSEKTDERFPRYEKDGRTDGHTDGHTDGRKISQLNHN